MYKVDVTIEGVAPLLQHRYNPMYLQTASQQSATKKTGQIDYSLEWLETMYVTDNGLLYQPASHIEGSLVEAAKRYKMKGARGKTWKDPIRSYCYVLPDQILHLYRDDVVPAPDASLLETPTSHLCVSIMRVVVQRAAVARSRLMLNTGWMLRFEVEVHDDQVQPNVLREILDEAGRAIGIGDFRGRYGRFKVCAFDI